MDSNNVFKYSDRVRIEHNDPFPWKLTLVVVFVVLGIVGSFFAYRLIKLQNKDEVVVKTKLRREYFIALTKFTSFENSLNFEDLISQEIAVFQEDEAKVKEMLGDSQRNFQFIDDEDIYEWDRSSNFDGIIIVPIEKSDFRLKTLKVDDILIWEHTLDQEPYPLVYEENIEIEVASDTEVVEDESNFDISEIITYVAGGEVIPARAVARKFRRTEDYTFPFHGVVDIFQNADFSSILLENSISGRPEPCYGCMWFVGDEDFIGGLEYLGVDIVSMAGNHMGDGGEVGVGRTIEVLDEAGILHTGASALNQDDASKPVIVEIDGTKFAFLGYDDVAYYHWAGDNHWGVARISARLDSGVKTLLSNKIEEDINLAREEADFVIVLMSWGDQEYINFALDYQKEMGHALIDAGADLIVGSHQHWVNQIEFYEGKVIFYGVGNFVFDQTHTDPTREGAFLKFYFYNGELVHVLIIPHQTCGPQQSKVDDENCNHFQPQILSENDDVYSTILGRMFEHSEI